MGTLQFVESGKHVHESSRTVFAVHGNNLRVDGDADVTGVPEVPWPLLSLISHAIAYIEDRHV